MPCWAASVQFIKLIFKLCPHMFFCHVCLVFMKLFEGKKLSGLWFKNIAQDGMEN